MVGWLDDDHRDVFLEGLDTVGLPALLPPCETFHNHRLPYVGGGIGGARSPHLVPDVRGVRWRGAVSAAGWGGGGGAQPDGAGTGGAGRPDHLTTSFERPHLQPAGHRPARCSRLRTPSRPLQRPHLHVLHIQFIPEYGPGCSPRRSRRSSTPPASRRSRVPACRSKTVQRVPGLSSCGGSYRPTQRWSSLSAMTELKAGKCSATGSDCHSFRL